MMKIVTFELDEFKPEGLTKKIRAAKLKEDAQVDYLNEKAINEHARTVLGRAIQGELRGLAFSEKIFRHEVAERRVTYKTINSFYQVLTGRELEEGELLFYFAHHIKGTNPEDPNSPVLKDKEAMHRLFEKHVDLDSIKKSKKGTLLEKEIRNQCYEMFAEAHFWIMPFRPDELRRHCAERGVNFKDLVVDEKGMLRNACMSPRCKHFLQPMSHKTFSEHLQLWRKRKPTRFHADAILALKSGKSPAQIAEQFFKSGKINERHRKDIELVKEYIARIK